MKKILAVIVGLIVVTGIVWHYANRDAAAPAAASLLPETTLLYVTLPDVPRSREEWQRTEINALWQEPEVQAFLEKPLAALRDALGTRKSDSALNSLVQERAWGLLQGEVFVAVTHLSPPPIMDAGVVFGADVKQKRLEAQGFLKLIEHDLANHYPNSTATDKSYLGKTYTIWQLRDNQQVCHAFLNSLLVFTLDENLMRDVITRFAGQAPADSKPLAGSARFKEVLKHIPAGHEGVAYLGVEHLLGIVAPFLALSPQAGEMFQKFVAIRSAATSVTFNDALIQDVSLVTYSGNHTPAPVVERHTLALTSPDTSLYAVHSADLAASYRSAMDTLAKSGNATFSSAAAQFERTLRERGLRLDDVLAGLGPEMACLGIWREGARLPDIALAIETRSATQLRANMDAAMDALKNATMSQSNAEPWEAQTYLGETLHTWHIGGTDVSPSYVVTDKLLILASNVDYARALVAQSKNPTPTLAGNSGFAQALKRVPEKSSSLAYCDLPRLFGALYALTRANAQENPFVDLGKLPRSETLTKHFAPFISATVDAADAQTTTTFSSLGKPLTFVVGAVSVIGAAQPYLAQYLPVIIPALPTMFSGTASPPGKSRTAPSQTPPTR